MHGRNHPLEQTPHLAAALTAVILGVVVVVAVGFYARSLEYRSITAIAADEAVVERDGKMGPVKNQGAALQQAALDTGCLLPVYGSSELNLLTPYNRPFHPTVVFHDRPTGFTTFPVGKAESTCLIILQKLAAVGPALRGRKVAISLTPCFFFRRITVRQGAYVGNFSDLHAGELAFNTRLSLPLRQAAARRMLQYPASVAHRPFLRFALENLASGSPLSLACYDAVFPLGMLHNAIIRYQDHWNVVRYLWTHPVKTWSPGTPRSAPPPDWAMLHRQADATYPSHCSNNALGVDNDKWNGVYREEALKLRNTPAEEVVLSTMEKNLEWVDLELLLRELNELGARPLLLSMPIHGPWYDYCGVSYTARRVYYEKLRAISARHHAPLVDFADHDGDRSFCCDPMGHLAPRGLLYYGQVFDGFFHDTIPPQSELPAPAPAVIRTTEADLHARDGRQGVQDELPNQRSGEQKP